MDPKGIKNFINQIFSLWINPELKIRLDKGLIKEDYRLYKAQVIFTVDGRKIIRLNEEVRAIIKTNKQLILDMSINFFQNGETIVRLDRVSEEEHFAHVTLARIGTLWTIAFDFRYGIGSSKDCFNLGKEFLETAEMAFEKGNYQSTVSNIYAAMENLGKARILLYPDLYKKSITHRETANRINIHANTTSVINPVFAELFNYIQKLYCEKGVRYVPNVSVDVSKIKKAVHETRTLLQEITKLYGKSVIYK